MPQQIHNTSIISPKAQIADDVQIGPYCVIGDNVTIARGTRLISNVVIEGRTTIGEDCVIYPFVSLGLPPQDLKYKGQDTALVIGNRNVIRENVTIHRASVSGDGVTEVGDNNFIMAYVHIAHDCKIGSNIIMANCVTLAGHVTVQSYAVMGGIIGVHQFTRIGSYCMVGGMSAVVKDIPPYTMASGIRAKLYGLNTVGLKRHGFSNQTISELKKAYKILFREKLTIKQAITKVKETVSDIPEVRHLLQFIEQNSRSICR